MNVNLFFRAFAVATAFAVSGALTSHVMAEPVPAANVVTNQPTVKVLPGRVEISNPGDEARQVVVYALTGQIVKTIVAQPGVTTIELPAGYYIIKCDRMSCRVVVK